jgi:hypothetical protein
VIVIFSFPPQATLNNGVRSHERKTKKAWRLLLLRLHSLEEATTPTRGLAAEALAVTEMDSLARRAEIEAAEAEVEAVLVVVVALEARVSVMARAQAITRIPKEVQDRLWQTLALPSATGAKALPLTLADGVKAPTLFHHLLLMDGAKLHRQSRQLSLKIKLNQLPRRLTFLSTGLLILRSHPTPLLLSLLLLLLPNLLAFQQAQNCLGLKSLGA